MIINDVTQLNPISVLAVSTPESTGELSSIIRKSEVPVSIGGGRFSMGGLTVERIYDYRIFKDRFLQLPLFPIQMNYRIQVEDWNGISLFDDFPESER
jgi:hypothetical protein